MLVGFKIHFSMLKVFSLLVFFILTGRYCRTGRIHNICSTEHIKRVFVGKGEFGAVSAVNVTRKSSNMSFRDDCQMEIMTCPSCVISLTFRLINLDCRCGSRFDLFLCNPYRCDYVWITESPNDDTSGMSFCEVFPVPGWHGRNLGFKSKTSTLRISFFYSRAYSNAFTLDYKSEPNRQFFFGTSQYPLDLNLSTGFISSPFFPSAYPRDLIAEYVLVCIKRSNFSFLKASNVLPDGDNNCRIHLLFTDFQLASSSVIEFYEKSHRVGIVTGTSFRPPTIISTTNALTVRFYALGQSSIGFKGIFSFISENFLKKMTEVSTDCGGYIDGFGGSITMMKMVDSQVKLFDCIWLIKPSDNFLNVKTHLYLKVITFLDFAGGAELRIRQGFTSESPILENLRYPVFQNFQEHIIPVELGYYVSLKAFFSPKSRFEVSYAAFSQNKCLLPSEFLCENFRCILKKLICDGFDHCGDNSDESAICRRGLILDRKWRTNVPNYYFPKMTEYSHLKTTSILLIAGLVGSVFLSLSLAVVLCRIVSKSGRQRTLENQSLESQSCSSDLQDYIASNVSVEDVVIDDPPSYEPPPNYEELIKMFVDGSRNFKDFNESSKMAV